MDETKGKENLKKFCSSRDGKYEKQKVLRGINERQSDNGGRNTGVEPACVRIGTGRLPATKSEPLKSLQSQGL